MLTRVLQINTGFITNSSSAVHFFDPRILEHPEVKAFMDAYDIKECVGNNMWDRGNCASLLITDGAKARAQAQLADNDYGMTGPTVTVPGVVLIYGDEYDSVIAELCGIMRDAAAGTGMHLNSDEYN